VPLAFVALNDDAGSATLSTRPSPYPPLENRNRARGKKFQVVQNKIKSTTFS